jgi:nitrogen regulatory protein P-II 1
LIKKIEAVIQPFKLDEVKAALKAIGVEGITISEVRGHGRQLGHTEIYRGHEYQVDLLPKIKLEIITSHNRVEQIAKALISAARTGSIGDGKIFISDIAEVIRIRDEDRGEDAL